MQIARVHALGFGPLTGPALEFPEGMTLVFGPNEAGKSSWHSALYAGVCGIRRARGRPTAADQAFELRHAPWDGGPWKVRAVVVLADGRRIELTQDLAARDGTAIDLATGRDVASESRILNEQVPDASRWLGLDREAFRSVACVSQTALLVIRQQPGQLAEHLQRAAATAGTDATAAEAITRIEAFMADQVGTDRAWTKPLARARADLQAADASLAQARQTHADLAQLREQLHAASEASQLAQHQLRAAEAAYAGHRATTAQERAGRAVELAAKYPEPPAQLASDDAIAQQARAAVNTYRNRPPAPVLEGSSVAAIQAELDALPEVPTGDLEPVPEVDSAHNAVREARATVQSLTNLQPPFSAPPQRTAEQTRGLRQLADALAEPLPVASPMPGEQAQHRDPARPAMSGSLLAMGAIVAAILLVAGVVAVTAARQPIGWAAAVTGAAIGAWLLTAVLRGHTRQIAALRDLQMANPAGAMRMAAEQRLTDARARVTTLGLAPEPDALRELADADDHARTAAGQWDAWQASHRKADSDLQTALGQLSRELGARGAPLTQDPEDDFRRYVDACAHRRQQATRASRRPGLESQLRDRRQAEEQVTDADTRRSTAERGLRTAASACQVPDANTGALDDLADVVEKWLEQRGQAIGEHQQAVEEYAILQQLLDGSTLDEIKEESARLADAAKAVAHALDPAEIARIELGPDPVATLSELQAGTRKVGEAVTGLQTRVDERQGNVPEVADAEEALTQAAARVERLERLSHILSTTRSLLMQAQDSVHRTIAPQLANAIGPHLGTVTAGRYTEAAVDPDDLQVRVRAASGDWRVAERLSHGTAEQVYLLLRAALAQYLATTGEPCPLILDDPTAYADDLRTSAMLQVLHHVSAERQVVVFSHDTHVLSWARDSLNGPRDKIIQLDTMPPA